MFQLRLIKHTLFIITIAGLIGSMPDVSQAYTDLLIPMEISNSNLSIKTVYSDSPTRIIIPSIGIDIEVKNSKISNGTWEVPEVVAGFGEGSSFIDDPFGNSIIFAHARKNLFISLPEVKEGDEIIILGNNSEYRYTAISTEKILPNEISKVISKGDQNLTLFTCEGINDEYRFLVKAIRNTVSTINL